MRIALLTADWQTNGGVAMYVRLLAGEWAKAGHDVQVIHGDTSNDAQDVSPDFRVNGIPGALRPSAYRDPRLGRAVLERLEAFRPDVAHFNSSNDFPLEAAVRRRIPSLKTFHVHDFCPAGTKYHFALERRCVVPTGALCVPRMGYLRCTLSKRPQVIWSAYRRTRRANAHNQQFSRIVVCSESVRRDTVASGFDDARVSVVPLFMEAAPLPPSTSREVLFVGRLVRSKGADLLLESLRRLSGEWRAVIAGDGIELASLRAQAARLGIQDRVTFAGWLDRPALDAAYARAAVVAMPSRWPEPFGMVGLEALMRSRPVVAFAVGGIPEWLEEGRGGHLVTPNDTAAFAERLQQLLDRPGQSRELAASGRARAVDEFSATRHLERLRGVYERTSLAG